MSSFPGSPKLLRGAIIGIDIFNPLSSVVVFQYNPDTLSRSIQPQGSSGEDKVEAMRLKGPPVETIKLDAEFDATDQLEKQEEPGSTFGVTPQLSALEMLVYPKSALVVFNSIMLALGTIEVIPPVAPLTLFVWGIKRVLPVRVTDMSITEEAFDPKLNPIRAKVSLGLRVLTYADLPLLHPGYGLFLAHQVVKETMATIGSVNSVASVFGGDVKLF